MYASHNIILARKREEAKKDKRDAMKRHPHIVKN